MKEYNILFIKKNLKKFTNKNSLLKIFNNEPNHKYIHMYIT
jgi:hypothetical protein